MPKLKCNVANCTYNCDRLCCRNAIDIEGPAARSKKETACFSYVEKGNKSFMYEIASLDKNPKPETYVYCDAINCVFEHDSRCFADHIEIEKVVTEDKKNQGEETKYNEMFWKNDGTMCKTFEKRD